MKSALKEQYESKIVPELMKKFGTKNIMAAPKILKVTINCGMGKYIKEKEAVDEVFENLKTIAGQKPVFTKSKKSISGFKIRKGQEIGVLLSIRGLRMWHFLERLVKVALPRVRDFRGIDTKNFDQNGNLNLAIREQVVFPEIVPENVKNIFGFQINVTTSAKTKEEGLELFKLLGFPIKQD
ncbi:MAG: 50S ribosomal protein L5 [Candidatus Moranbacteria bacterium RBG_13_45_13]|nr:MAG: 50S ribosomal protein L5 [Candidatus Moranbacteria bacterium RBG_13_45_13]